MITYKRIDYKVAKDFLLPRHYSGRIPSISYAYGAFEDEELKAVCTFGMPASSSLCRGVAGIEWKDNVLELNRLCRLEDYDKPLSQFVSYCLKDLKQYNLIIVSYSDTEMNHHGYIYQACNFTYTGATKERTDKYTEGNKHSRHYSKDMDNSLRKVRSSKHRYIYFCGSSKVQIKKMKKALKYPIMKYPKGDNKNYVLGEFLQPRIIKTKENNNE